MKTTIRKSRNGKLHLSLGPFAAHCSSGNRGMNFDGEVSAENAAMFSTECFCKKCFGIQPLATIKRMLEANLMTMATKGKTVQAIKKKAEQLKKKLNGKPVKENFGQKEVRQLEDFVGDIYSYPYEDRSKIQSIISDFDNWAMNYTG